MPTETILERARFIGDPGQARAFITGLPAFHGAGAILASEAPEDQDLLNQDLPEADLRTLGQISRAVEAIRPAARANGHTPLEATSQVTAPAVVDTGVALANGHVVIAEREKVLRRL